MADNVKSENTMKDLAKQLVGKEVKLSPSTAFFIDDPKQYTLNTYATPPKESVVIKEGWKLRSTMKNIVAGILRVIDPKTKEDISMKFGGPELPVGRNKTTPIVKAPKSIDTEDSRDKVLRRLLNNTLVEKVLEAISSASLPFDSLERILELEIQGENPSYTPRGPVVEGINEIIKNTSGVGRAGRVEDGEPIKVTHK